MGKNIGAIGAFEKKKGKKGGGKCLSHSLKYLPWITLNISKKKKKRKKNKKEKRGGGIAYHTP